MTVWPWTSYLALSPAPGAPHRHAHCTQQREPLAWDPAVYPLPELQLPQDDSSCVALGEGPLQPPSPPL